MSSSPPSPDTSTEDEASLPESSASTKGPPLTSRSAPPSPISTPAAWSSIPAVSPTTTSHSLPTSRRSISSPVNDVLRPVALSPRTSALVRWLQRQPRTPSALASPPITGQRGAIGGEIGGAGPVEDADPLTAAGARADAEQDGTGSGASLEAPFGFDTPAVSRGPVAPESVQDRRGEWIIVEQENGSGGTCRFRELVGPWNGPTPPARESDVPFIPWLNAEHATAQITPPVPSPGRMRELRLRTPPPERGLGAAIDMPGSPSPSPVHRATPLAASASDDIAALDGESPNEEAGDDIRQSTGPTASERLAQVTASTTPTPTDTTYVFPTLIPLDTPILTDTASGSSKNISKTDYDRCPCQDCRRLRIQGKPPNPAHQPICEDDFNVSDMMDLIDVYHDTFNPHPVRMERERKRRARCRRVNGIEHYVLGSKLRGVERDDLYRRSLLRKSDATRLKKTTVKVSSTAKARGTRGPPAMGKGTPPRRDDWPVLRSHNSDGNDDTADLGSPAAGDQVVQSPGSQRVKQTLTIIPAASLAATAEAVFVSLSTLSTPGNERWVLPPRSGARGPTYGLSRSMSLSIVEKQKVSSRQRAEQTQPGPTNVVSQPGVEHSLLDFLKLGIDGDEDCKDGQGSSEYPEPEHGRAEDKHRHLDDKPEDLPRDNGGFTRNSPSATWPPEIRTYYEELMRPFQPDTSSPFYSSRSRSTPIERSSPEDSDSDDSDKTITPQSSSSQAEQPPKASSSRAHKAPPSPKGPKRTVPDDGAIMMSPRRTLSWHSMPMKRSSGHVRAISGDSTADLFKAKHPAAPGRPPSSPRPAARSIPPPPGFEALPPQVYRDPLVDWKVPGPESPVAISISPASPQPESPPMGDRQSKAGRAGSLGRGSRTAEPARNAPFQPSTPRVYAGDESVGMARGEHVAAVRARVRMEISPESDATGTDEMLANETMQTIALAEAIILNIAPADKAKLDEAAVKLDTHRLALNEAIYRLMGSPAVDKDDSDSSGSDEENATVRSPESSTSEATPSQIPLSTDAEADDTPNSVDDEFLVTPHLPSRSSPATQGPSRVLPFDNDTHRDRGDGGYVEERRYTRAEKGKGRAQPIVPFEGLSDEPARDAQSGAGTSERSFVSPEDPTLQSTAAGDALQLRRFAAAASPIDESAHEEETTMWSGLRGYDHTFGDTSASIELDDPFAHDLRHPAAQRQRVPDLAYDQMNIAQLGEAEIVAVTQISKLQMRRNELSPSSAGVGTSSSPNRASETELARIDARLVRWNRRLQQIAYFMGLAPEMEQRLSTPPSHATSFESVSMARQSGEEHSALGATATPESFIPDIEDISPSSTQESDREAAQDTSADALLAMHIQALMDSGYEDEADGIMGTRSVDGHLEPAFEMGPSRGQRSGSPTQAALSEDISVDLHASSGIGSSQPVSMPATERAAIVDDDSVLVPTDDDFEERLGTSPDEEMHSLGRRGASGVGKLVVMGEDYRPEDHGHQRTPPGRPARLPVETTISESHEGKRVTPSIRLDKRMARMKGLTATTPPAKQVAFASPDGLRVEMDDERPDEGLQSSANLLAPFAPGSNAGGNMEASPLESGTFMYAHFPLRNLPLSRVPILPSAAPGSTTPETVESRSPSPAAASGCPCLNDLMSTPPPLRETRSYSDNDVRSPYTPPTDTSDSNLIGEGYYSESGLPSTPRGRSGSPSSMSKTGMAGISTQIRWPKGPANGQIPRWGRNTFAALIESRIIRRPRSKDPRDVILPPLPGAALLVAPVRPPDTPEWRTDEDIAHLPPVTQQEVEAGVEPRARRLHDTLRLEAGPGILVTPPTPQAALDVSSSSQVKRERAMRQLQTSLLLDEHEDEVIGSESEKESEPEAREERDGSVEASQRLQDKFGMAGRAGGVQNKDMVAVPGFSPSDTSARTGRPGLQRRHSTGREGFPTLPGPKQTISRPSSPVRSRPQSPREDGSIVNRSSIDDIVDSTAGGDHTFSPRYKQAGRGLAFLRKGSPTLSGVSAQAVSENEGDLSGAECAAVDGEYSLKVPRSAPTTMNMEGPSPAATQEPMIPHTTRIAQSDNRPQSQLKPAIGMMVRGVSKPTSSRADGRDGETGPAANVSADRDFEAPDDILSTQTTTRIVRQSDIHHPLSARSSATDGNIRAETDEAFDAQLPTELIQHDFNPAPAHLPSDPPSRTVRPTFRNARDEFEYYLDVYEREQLLAEADGRMILPDRFNVRRWRSGENRAPAPTMEVVRVQEVELPPLMAEDVEFIAHVLRRLMFLFMVGMFGLLGHYLWRNRAWGWFFA